MHIECVATPDELDMGFDLPAVVGKVITDFPVIRRGAEGDVVSYLQGLLAIKKDGAFGSTTQTAVIKYQKSRGLIADGIVGFGTWTALITKQPTGVSHKRFTLMKRHNKAKVCNICGGVKSHFPTCSKLKPIPDPLPPETPPYTPPEPRCALCGLAARTTLPAARMR